MELPFDCGCDNRREIMGAENWQQDALVIGGALIVLAVVFLALKK